MRLARAVAPWIALLAVVCTTGCERVMRNMYDQPKLKTNATSPLFDDGEASRPPPPGSVPASIGESAANASGRRGGATVSALDAADLAATLPPVVDATMLARGRDRYGIYCVPCHSAVGDGDGMVVRRGFPAPPSYAIARLREAPDRHFFDVITRGYGVMYPYADRIDATDRWAVVAYVRHLQRDVLGDPRASIAAAAAAASNPALMGAPR